MADRYSHSIDERVVTAWRIVITLSLLVLYVPAVVGGILFLIGMPGIATSIAVGIIWGVCLLCGWVGIGILPRWKHRHWSYRIEDGVVQIRNGILWRDSVAIPISRLQHVDLHRGPLERRFGLASVVLHTAGTRHASHTIPGLDADVAIGLRDRLIQSIEARASHTPSAVENASPATEVTVASGQLRSEVPTTDMKQPEASVPVADDE